MSVRSLEPKSHSFMLRYLLLNLSYKMKFDQPSLLLLLLQYPASAGEPPKGLRGFKKVFLLPGQKQSIALSLSDQDLSIWDETLSGWALVKGSFRVHIGSSSRDIRLTATLTV